MSQTGVLSSPFYTYTGYNGGIKGMIKVGFITLISKQIINSELFKTFPNPTNERFTVKSKLKIKNISIVS